MGWGGVGCFRYAAAAPSGAPREPLVGRAGGTRPYPAGRPGAPTAEHGQHGRAGWAGVTPASASDVVPDVVPDACGSGHPRATPPSALKKKRNDNDSNFFKTAVPVRSHGKMVDAVSSLSPAAS